MSGFTTADTFSSLIDEVIVSLQGYGVNVDQVVTLLAPLTPTALSITVDDPKSLSKGIIEVDQELIYLSSVTNGIGIIPPWGRGFKGTAADTHFAGAPVFVSPNYPRSIVAREINNTIRSVYPNLFAVKTYDFTFDGLNWQYGLPQGTDRVIAVDYRFFQIDGWQPLRRWDITNSAYAGDFSTGTVLSLAETIPAGSIVHVTYATQPSVLSPESVAFTESGLPESCRDVIVYGAAARLLPWTDAGRLPVTTVMSDAQDEQKPVGQATQAGRYFMQLHMQRVMQERQSLLLRYPINAHRIR